MQRLFDDFRPVVATEVAFLNRGKGIDVPDVQSAIEKVYMEINRTNPTLEIVSVKDFGAKGDGVTDDTAAIERAIEAVRSKGGGIVYFPSGTYRTTRTITLPSSRIKLIGEDKFTSKIVGDFSGHMFSLAWRNYCAFENLTISGNRDSGIREDLGTGYLIEISQSNHVTLRNCVFEYNGDWAVWAFRSEHLKVIDSLFLNCTRDIRIDGGGAEYGVELVGNKFIHNGSYKSHLSVLIFNCSHVHISSNFVDGVGLNPIENPGQQGTWGNGFFIYSCRNVTITGNTVRNCYWSPVVLGEKITRFSVTGNIFEARDGRAAAWIEQPNAEWGVFADNFLNGSLMVGDNGGDNLSITGNVIRTNHRGIDCSFGAKNCIISDNLIRSYAETPRESGIYIWEKRNEDTCVVITGNIITGFDTAIRINNLYSEGPVHGLVITSNRMHNCTKNIAKGTGITIEDDVIISNNSPDDTIVNL